MASRSFVLTCLTCALALVGAGCSDAPAQVMDMGGDPVEINQHPTGSIEIPSLCDRAQIDKRVSFGGVDTFAFAWANDHYEVVYSDITTKDIFSVHLGKDGSMLDAPVAVEITEAPSLLPALLPTPSGFAVVWQEEDAQPHVRAHALDLSGRPIGSSHIIAYGRSAQMRPVLAASPLGVAVSWMDQVPASTTDIDMVGDSTTYVGLLNDSLQLRNDVPPQRVNPKSRSAYPWLVGSDSKLALLWSDNRSGVIDPYFGPIGADLSLESSTDVRGAAVENAAQLGRMHLTDVGYIAAWEDLRTGSEEIYMSLLDLDGNRYAGGIVEEPGTGNANWPHIAWTGSSAAIVYYQFRSGRPQIFLTFIDQNGMRIQGAADAQVSNSGEWARYPDVLWNGSEFAVMWIDARDGVPELYFNRALCKKPAPI
jgi:hypothetical protein